LLKSGKAQEELSEMVNQIYRWDRKSEERAGTAYIILLHLGHIIPIDLAD
jgi:hypothetical protein